MTEDDILWEDGPLWVGKTGKREFTLFKTGTTHSTGFLQFQNASQAIENGKALSTRPDLVERLTA